MKSEEEFWVFIDRTKLESDPQAVKIYGNVSKMAREENITINGKVYNERSLYWQTSKTGTWLTDKYLIKRCPVIRSAHKNRKKQS